MVLKQTDYIRDIIITDYYTSESLATAAIARRNTEAEVKSAELMRKAAYKLGTCSAIHIREMGTMLQMAKNPNIVSPFDIKSKYGKNSKR